MVSGTPASQYEVKALGTVLVGDIGVLTFSTNFQDDYYAIANADGDVYLIINRLNQSILGFTPKESRE